MTPHAKLFTAAASIGCALIAFSADRALTAASEIQSTDNAYVMADYTTVAPNISGLIDKVFVTDHQTVRAGQEVAHIDDREYRAAVTLANANFTAAQAAVQNADSELRRHATVIAQAEATVRVDEAALAFAENNAKRYHTLFNGGGTALEKQQGAASALQQASATKARDEAALASARAQVDTLKAQRDQAIANATAAQSDLEKALLSLSHTHIVSSIDGTVGQLSARVGNYVSPGPPLLAVVPLQSAYVIANFRETQLAGFGLGQPVAVAVDSFPEGELKGVIDSISPASGATFSAIQPDNATGNFTKVVQRIAIKIRLIKGQPLLSHLRVGMSVTASVDTTRRE
ncbi:HlyD family secretion protein [Rhizobium panacihumi]|uniref:HlyD family secretion protein n=1 Tax=Rhizobium panacihumi TaxID=2008450 RepID=UPI003D791D24